MPIEPLEERYSTQWAEWWPQGFRDKGIEEYTIIGESLTDKVETGQFLDCYSTNHWKMTQMASLIGHIHKGFIRDDDVIFFHDLWFPGIEALGYIRDIAKHKFRIAGYLHAGAYDPADLLHQVGMHEWVTGIEQSWLKLFDHVFVGSRYHETLLEKLAGESLPHVHPIGYPVHVPDIDVPKENIVVFPHRLAWEKNPHMFDNLAKHFDGKATFIKTKDVWTDKQAYYELLAKAKVSVSCAGQETFGIAMVESALLGCIPVVPNDLSYTSTMEMRCRYNSFQEAGAMIAEALQSKPYVYPYKEKFSINNIVGEVIYALTR